jgi:hypothetical protein
LGDRRLFQAAGILGNGKHLPSAATAGPSTSAATTANSQCGPTLLGVGVPMVHRLARVTTDRKACNRIEVAPSGLESLLALAFKTER